MVSYDLVCPAGVEPTTFVFGGLHRKNILLNSHWNLNIPILHLTNPSKVFMLWLDRQRVSRVE